MDKDGSHAVLFFMKKSLAAGLPLLLAGSALAGDGLSFSLKADAYSEPVAIHAFTHDWSDSLSRGDQAFAHARAELSRREGNDEFALLWRYDYLLSFHEGTARFYHTYAHDGTPVSGAYPIEIRARHTEAWGFRWKHDFVPRPGLTLSPAINLLQGYGLTEGAVDGSVNLRTPGFDSRDFRSADLQVGYHYDQPRLHEDDLGWHPKGPEAMGYSLDIGAQWNPRPSLTLGLLARDLLGRLYWRDAPATRYDFDYQADPAQRSLTGQLSVDDRYVQHLPVRTEAWVRYLTAGGIKAGGVVRSNRLGALATLSLGSERLPGNPELLWEPGTGAWGMEFHGRHYGLRWLADNPDASKAHRLSVTVAVFRGW